jgi:hypothetical protein
VLAKGFGQAVSSCLVKISWFPVYLFCIRVEELNQFCSHDLYGSRHTKWVDNTGRNVRCIDSVENFKMHNVSQEPSQNTDKVEKLEYPYPYSARASYL